MRLLRIRFPLGFVRQRLNRASRAHVLSVAEVSKREKYAVRVNSSLKERNTERANKATSTLRVQYLCFTILTW